MAGEGARQAQGGQRQADWAEVRRAGGGEDEWARPGEHWLCLDGVPESLAGA